MKFDELENNMIHEIYQSLDSVDQENKVTKQFMNSTFIKRFDDSESGNSILAICTAQIEEELSEEERVLSAVIMSGYGLDHVILTEHAQLEELVSDFRDSEDSKWFHGLGKKALFDYLLGNLKREEKFFRKKPKKMNTSNKRWSNFCDDCVILAALGYVLYKKEIMLMHPRQYEQSIAGHIDAWICGANAKLPTLISGIEVRKTK